MSMTSGAVWNEFNGPVQLGRTRARVRMHGSSGKGEPRRRWTVSPPCLQSGVTFHACLERVWHRLHRVLVMAYSG